MDTFLALILSAVFLITALLYASVGHAGASGYLTTMALLGVAPATMRPTALVLNILVASIAAFKFYRAGAFSWSLFWPFAVTSIPLAFIGGGITLPSNAYKVVVGLILIYAAYRMFRSTRAVTPEIVTSPPLTLALFSGAGIGLLSGLTGTGGGIFLSPLLLFMHWAEPRQASGVSAVFILMNSLAGLSGQLTSLSALPNVLPLWLIAVSLGGWFGAEYGSKRWSGYQIRRALAVVMVIAGFKLILT
jgi:uncharacterized membrane protein YfcA